MEDESACFRLTWTGVVSPRMSLLVSSLQRQPRKQGGVGMTSGEVDEGSPPARGVAGQAPGQLQLASMLGLEPDNFEEACIAGRRLDPAMDDDEFLSDGESTNGESEDDLPNDSEEETSDPFNDGEDRNPEDDNIDTNQDVEAFEGAKVAAVARWDPTDAFI
uniref:Uncharacterized protein n=1 Tax=Saccharum officinarum TaxID=4547 RepID=A0A678TQD0_SACOF|nr:hypothetical protein SO145G11_000003 [Saccharum officinarum]